MWPNRDPMGEKGANLLYGFGFLDVFGEESRENPYMMVDNDPIHLFDTLGLQSVPVTLAEAMAQGNVVDVEAVLAGAEEGSPTYDIATAWLKKVAECEALHAAYDISKCQGCKTCVNKEQAIANAACFSKEIALRAAYVAKKCDYCLAGSISGPGGSKGAEAGHVEQIAVKTAALLRCTGMIPTLPSVTSPPPQ
jgi:hypothetical protein